MVIAMAIAMAIVIAIAMAIAIAVPMAIAMAVAMTIAIAAASLKLHTHVFWVRAATKLVGFPPKWGLSWEKMVRLDWKINHDSHARIHEPS